MFIKKCNFAAGLCQKIAPQFNTNQIIQGFLFILKTHKWFFFMSENV